MLSSNILNSASSIAGHTSSSEVYCDWNYVEQIQFRPIKIHKFSSISRSLLRILMCGYLAAARCICNLNFSLLTHCLSLAVIMNWNSWVGRGGASAYQLVLLGASDLITCTHLHEHAVLHNVHYQYAELMYTYCGEQGHWIKPCVNVKMIVSGIELLWCIFLTHNYG